MKKFALIVGMVLVSAILLSGQAMANDDSATIQDPCAWTAVDTVTGAVDSDIMTDSTQTPPEDEEAPPDDEEAPPDDEEPLPDDETPEDAPTPSQD